MTTEQLQDFADKHFPKESALKVTPFKLFFNMLIAFLKDVLTDGNINNLIYAVFGTNTIDGKTIKEILGDPNFNGNSLLSYIKQKGDVKYFTDANLIENQVADSYEFFRILVTQTELQLWVLDKTLNKFKNLTTETNSIPLTGTEDDSPVTGRLEFQSQQVIVSDWNEQEPGLGLIIDSQKIIQTKNGNMSALRPDSLTLSKSGETILMSMSNGIQANKYFPPANDYSFVQKQFVMSVLAGLYKIKGSVADFASLPTDNQTEGDVYNLLDSGKNYVWVLNLNNTGNAGWDELGGNIDLTDYAKTSDLENYLPLSGTAAGKPLTGVIEIDNSASYFGGMKQTSTMGGGSKEITFFGDEKIIIQDNSEDYNQKGSLTLNQNGIDLRVINSDGFNSTDVSSIQSTPNIINLELTKTISGELQPIVGLYMDNSGLIISGIENANDNADFQQELVRSSDNRIGFKNKKMNVLKSIIQITNGTFEPTFIDLENEIGNIVWTRTGQGEYIGELANAFPISKFWANAHISTGDGTVPFGCRIGRVNDNQVYLSIFKTAEGNPADAAGNCGFLEINVFN